MKPLAQITKEDIKKIKMIVLDVDGVLVPRGTKIRQKGDTIVLGIKKIKKKEIELIENIVRAGLLVNISSGRGLYMLQKMFQSVLSQVSITYENGSATWHKGKIYQHINSFAELSAVLPKLEKAAKKNKKVKGFEPKEFIITLHCKERAPEIEKIVRKYKKLTTVWNQEAYDIVIKGRQTKARGLRHVMNLFKLKKENVLVIGDNLNDREMLKAGGLPVSADKDRVKGKFYVPQSDKHFPAGVLMEKILSLKGKSSL